jgi:hypothetical protein
MKLLFRHLIEKIESLDVEVFWSFHRLIDYEKIEGSMLFFLSSFV